MSNTFELIEFLGSPFDRNEKGCTSTAPLSPSETYALAKRNKLGLYYLDRLNQLGSISGLEKEYEEGLNRFEETSSTAARLCEAIDEITDDYAIFKFMKPFPHTPSDVDVLVFASTHDFHEMVSRLCHSGYSMIAESPSQTVLYDQRGGFDNIDRRSVGGKRGGRYYIDVYSDVSASHIIYISKETLRNHRESRMIDGGKIQTLDPIADLCVVLSHSIIPERLLTMADYYTAIHCIYTMDKTELDELCQLFIRNSMALACWHSVSAIAGIHERAHGFVPDKISYLIRSVEQEEDFTSDSYSCIDQLPLRYDTRTLIRVLMQRLGNEKGFRSIMSQAGHCVNPRLASWVVSNWRLRGNRETY